MEIKQKLKLIQQKKFQTQNNSLNPAQKTFATQNTNFNDRKSMIFEDKNKKFVEFPTTSKRSIQNSIINSIRDPEKDRLKKEKVQK